jgi:hypothetical protein
MTEFTPKRRQLVSFQLDDSFEAASSPAGPAPALERGLGSSGSGPLGGGPRPPRGGARPPGAGSGPLGSGSRPLGSGSRPLGRRKTVALGYHPDLPDSRDVITFSTQFAHSSPGKILADIANRKSVNLALLGATTALPQPRLHLGDKGCMPPVEDQGEIGSCTANAVIGIVEYLIRAAEGPQLDLSRMFLYKVTRRLLGWTGDTGAYIRTTIKAMRMFGVPPEADWPYEPALLDREPDAYHYAYAQNFRALGYIRLDGYGDIRAGFPSRGEATLDALKRTLADGYPVAFGFPVYSSIADMGRNFVIPLPQGRHDTVIGGHAVLAVGYDDTVEVDGNESPGAVIVRNSWGLEWAQQGYGYLPYKYITDELAVDLWTIVHGDFVEMS